MTYQHLILDRDASVAVVTINRPEKRNALNSETVDELRRAVLALKHDDAVRAVIVTGAGDKAFIAGADISELAVQTPVGGREHAHRGQHVLRSDGNDGQAGDRRDQRRRAWRRVRAGDGVHDPNRGRYRQDRPA